MNILANLLHSIHKQINLKFAEEGSFSVRIGPLQFLMQAQAASVHKLYHLDHLDDHQNLCDDHYGSVGNQKSKLRLAHLDFNRKLNSKPDLFSSIF